MNINMRHMVFFFAVIASPVLASTTFTGKVSAIDYSSDARSSYDVMISVAEIKPKTTNPWGIGFTQRQSDELIGQCADGLYLNKNRSKNFHIVLSAIVASQAQNNPVEFTVSDNKQCSITEISVSYQ
ncbi:hypothetical protein Q6U64_004251 [Vibrio vulnificus]|uniref:hypothetical protein n=1 Tax=Vibrio vulnificus TaxID=672 RepID=UPI000B24188C|nr:hypothetical protein [Vibrio vulnificus]ELL0561750.1 hypothetical protein [Vibrio vulnificus]ELV8701876.1 hypothetical protein [Vibrio vulnificus]MCU8501217.1 hypothetical protein [Vibrio vulnificus]HAS6064649.1 hypothetical protein [Vibrio vulnificus]